MIVRIIFFHADGSTIKISSHDYRLVHGKYNKRLKINIKIWQFDEKNGFAEMFEYLAGYRFENNFVWIKIII